MKIKQLKERDIKKRLYAKILAEGGKIRKMRWIGRRNAPDNLITLNGGHCLVETKRPGKPLSPGQAREFKKLEEGGLECRKIDTFKDIESLLFEMLYSGEPMSLREKP